MTPCLPEYLSRNLTRALRSCGLMTWPKLWGITPITVQRAVVTDVLTHQDVGDLSVILTHEQASVVLHNHTLNNGFPNVTNAVFTYDQFDLSTITPIAKARKYSLYRVNHENEEAYSFGRNFAI